MVGRFKMMIGTRGHFGIECDIGRAEGHSIVGDLRFWANGQRIGDEVSAVDIPCMLEHLSGPMYIGKQRCIPFLDSLTKEEIADLFHRYLFTEENFSEEVAEVVDFCCQRLMLSAPDVEGFDSVFVVLLGRVDGRDRLIWKYRGTDEVHEALLSNGEYDACLLSCFDFVEKQTGYRAKREEMGKNQFLWG